jgi:hypothetical protein
MLIPPLPLLNFFIAVVMISIGLDDYSIADTANDGCGCALCRFVFCSRTLAEPARQFSRCICRKRSHCLLRRCCVAAATAG